MKISEVPRKIETKVIVLEEKKIVIELTTEEAEIICSIHGKLCDLTSNRVSYNFFDRLSDIVRCSSNISVIDNEIKDVLH